MSDRPFSVLGLQQIAVGAADKAGLRRLWVDILGLEANGRAILAGIVDAGIEDHGFDPALDLVGQLDAVVVEGF